MAHLVLRGRQALVNSREVFVESVVSLDCHVYVCKQVSGPRQRDTTMSELGVYIPGGAALGDLLLAPFFWNRRGLCVGVVGECRAGPHSCLDSGQEVG